MTVLVSQNTGLLDHPDAVPYLRASGARGSAMAVSGYDAADDMLKVKSMQKKFRDDFPGTSVNAANWEVTTGTGAVVSVAGNTLQIQSGATANANTVLLSKEVFTIPFRLSFALALSQRIANQEFAIEALSVNPTTGVPDGKEIAAFIFDGTSATSHKYRVGTSGSSLDAAGSFATTAPAVQSVFEIEPYADEVWFHSTALDSNSGRSASVRRHQRIPSPNATYKIRIRFTNSATAPASSTGADIRFIACQDYAELTAEITASRGQSSIGQALAVNLVGGNATVTVSPLRPTSVAINSAATTNATSLTTTATSLHNLFATNIGANPAFVKLYNKASAPVVGTDVPVMIVPVPAAVGAMPGVASVNVGTLPIAFSSGLALAITGAMADTDATAVAAGQVKVMLSR